MNFIKRFSLYLLGIDDTEMSNQEKFIKDYYKSQKIDFTNDKSNISNLLENVSKKHDLISLGIVYDNDILYNTQNINKKEILKYADFFNNIKTGLKEKIVLLKDNPWIGIFEKDNYIFVTKREVKLSEIEINAIVYDILNNNNYFNDIDMELETNIQKNYIINKM